MGFQGKISEITLGTAQIGSNYGIANKKGKISRKKGIEILNTAWINGITCFDTSPVYGDSEIVIGTFLSSYNPSPSPMIITKLPKIMSEDIKNTVNFNRQIERFVINSLHSLKINTIPIYLIHHAPNLWEKKGIILNILKGMKEKGLIKNLGVSVYNPEDVQNAIETNLIRTIQIPINIFDLRLLNSGLLRELEKSKFIVFARSIFLQGLFFLKPNELPNGMEIAIKPLLKLNEIAESNESSISEIVFSFMKSLPGITSFLVGTETKQQVLENIKVFKSSKPLTSSLLNEIIDTFCDLPVNLINPNLWNRK